MKLTSAFDSGVMQPFEIVEDEITFDLKSGRNILNVLVEEAPAKLRVKLLLDKNGQKFIIGQGLIVSDDGFSFSAKPLEQVSEDTWQCMLSVPEGNIRIATRYPYGRDGLDKLICDTCGSSDSRWFILREQHRQVPMFQLGQDDGKKTVHYLIAGEDAWETAGSWVADEMIRSIYYGYDIRKELMKNAIIRILPLISPYSATREKGSYTTLDDTGIYGAATWGEASPPPEYAMVKSKVVETIQQGRLGFMMTIHSWQAQSEFTGLETIKSSGDKKLSEARQGWALDVMQTMIDRVPGGKVYFPECIWHPGLARDYLLGEHDVITFRVEITTHSQGIEAFRETGRCFLENLSTISDWRMVYGDQS